MLIDRIKARALGLSIADVNATLAITFGSAYANDFSREGRILRVLLQADAPYRMTPQDVLDLRVRNAQGEMVPFGAFTTVEWTAGPPQLQRYNGYPSMTISGLAGARPLDRRGDGRDGAPRGAAARRLRLRVDRHLVRGTAGRRARSALLLGLSLVVVFLLLAALYESWSVPLAVLLVVPLGVLGAVLFSMARGLAGRRVLQRRPDHDHRPGGEERDPDRRVRDRGGSRRARARSMRR